MGIPAIGAGEGLGVEVAVACSVALAVGLAVGVADGLIVGLGEWYRRGHSYSVYQLPLWQQAAGV